MSSIEELLQRIDARGIRLSPKADRLSYSAPPGSMDELLRAEIVARKAELLEHLATHNGGSLPTSAPVVKVPRNGPLFPLSAAQEQLWFLDRLEGPSATYNMVEAVWLQGALPEGVLEAGLNDVVARHEALRTTIDGAGDESDRPGQRIHETLQIPLSVVDVQHLPASARPSEALRVAEGWARLPFDLLAGPLLRAGLVRLSPDRHLLTLALHHIAADGWSLGVLWRDWSEACHARLRGQAPRWSPLPLQFVDYAVWEDQNLRAGSWAGLLAEWKVELAGAPPLLELPSDGSRSVRQGNRGARCSRFIPKEIVLQLQQLGTQHGTSLFTLLLCAWQVLLSRYSGQNDLIVGSPVARRIQPDLESIIGFLVNIVPLRVRWPADATLADALVAVRETVLGALSRAAVPFERLVHELNPQRSLVHNPVFQVGLALEYREPGGLSLPGVTTEPIHLDTGTSRFELMLWLTHTASGLELVLEYSQELFEPATAGRMLDHYARLVRGFGRQLSTPLSRLDFLEPAERNQLLIAWNATQMAHPREQCVHELVRAQAERTPESVAVVCGPHQLTYGQLWQRSAELGQALRACGVGAGTLVGVYVERSIEMVVAVLGVLEAGGAYVPLDPLFPQQRLGWMIEDAALPIIVTQSSLATTLPPHQARLVCLDQPTLQSSSRAAPKHLSEGGSSSSDSALRPPSTGSSSSSSSSSVVGPPSSESSSSSPDSFPLSAFRSPLSADSLAYVIFTSGSTGRPKGVQIEHRALVNFLAAMRREPGLTERDVVLAVTTLSFDIAGLELWLPLTTGATVVIATREIAADGKALADVISGCGVTLLQATPATWRLLLAAGWRGHQHLKALVGGESVPPELIGELAPCTAELWNMYGPTETTIWSTCGRLTVGAEPVSIGRPIGNTQIYIVNEALQLQPVGVPGELLIGGDGVARGYLNRPELTAEKFIPNPFGPGRLYRTGDLAKWQPDGTLICLGRSDSQVKLRGYRIELGEIEAALVAAEGVREAAVALRDEQLVAYLVPVNVAGDRAARAAALRDQLRERLPEYMVPATFVFLERLPLTPNGKVDRKGLPDPKGGAVSAAAAPFAAPRTETEARLTAIWEQLLNRKPVGIYDNFFDLGGHSLLAMKLFLEIEKQLNQKLPLATLFNHASVAALAQALEAAGAPSTTAWSSLVPIQPSGSRVPLYCIHGAGGNVLLYRDLAARLGNDQPVYGFQSRGLDGRTQPLETIEAMAQAYLAELRTVRPQGPYCLAGYCLGGLVAYQMARLLRLAGEEVALVALLDTYNPAEAGESSRIGATLQRARFHVGNLLQAGPRHLGSYVREKLRVARDGELANLLGLRRPANGSSGLGDSPMDDPGSHAGVQRVNDEAAEKFRPEPYDGSIVVFKPQMNYATMSDHLMGWGELARGGVQVVDLPVNPHAMLVEPFVEHLARALRQSLDAV